MNTIDSSQPDWLHTSTSHEPVTMVMKDGTHKLGALNYDIHNNRWIFSCRTRESRTKLRLVLRTEDLTSTKLLQGRVVNKPDRRAYKREWMRTYRQKQRAAVNIISSTESESHTNVFENFSDDEFQDNTVNVILPEKSVNEEDKKCQ